MDDGRAHREEEGEILHREDVEDRSIGAGAEMPVETSDARAINLREERFYAAHREPDVAPSPYELPSGYNDTRLVAMVRDPLWLFAYWEVQGDLIERIRLEEGPDHWDGGSWTMRVMDLTDQDAFDVGIDVYARNWYLEVGRPGHLLQLCLGRTLPSGRFVPLVYSNKTQAPPAGVSDLIDEEWMVLEEATVMAAGSFLIGATSPGMGRIMLEREMASGAIINVGSPGLQAKVAGQPFWLTVNTELILYGATQPGAQVTIFGQPIKLRPDGTFTARYALPDGTLVIPVQAISPQGTESITVTPVVSRETYS
ncbi:MAG: DUF4912 domain-containing protein [Firmicutes bacterium]|nr:DUF4912 domain-containing protein [Bacillota bacterium]